MEFSRRFLALLLIASFAAGAFAPAFAFAQANNAVAECTVDMAINSLGGKILGVAKDVGNALIDAVEDVPVVGGIIEGIGGIFGLGEDESKGSSADDPMYVKESGEQKDEVKKLQFDSCINAIKDTAFKVALAKLKKRLLDRMTDDIIGWINGNGDPKFITNFGDFLEDAAQAAVGDTARALGLAELCTPFKYRVPQLLTKVPEFSESVRCTLDDIVENVEGFYNDFEQGGWLAYTELWKPNNNPFGIFLKTHDQILKETAKKEDEARAAATIGGGYTPVYQCVEWTLSGVRKSDKKFVSFKIPADESFPYFHPTLPPAENSPAYQNALNTLIKPNYECTRPEWSLPPSATQQIAAIPYVADTQVVANSDDLSPYVNAIFDAAVNRVIKEGVKGLRGNLSKLRSESTTGRSPEQYPEGDPYRGYGEEYENATNFTRQLRTEIGAKIESARDNVGIASTTLTRLVALNNELIATTTLLADCEQGRTETSYQTCANTSSTLVAANSAKSRFVADRESLTEALTKIQELEDAFEENTDLSEAALRVLLSNLGSIHLTLKDMISKQQAFEMGLRNGLVIQRQALQACQTGIYSCTWTPAP